MKAIIMAGGAGTRLRPLTCELPKPMLPVANRPVIDYAVEHLKRHGIHEIGVTLQYMPHVIQDHLGNGKRFAAAFEYFTEATPLGTAGSVRQAFEFLSDTFVVLSGDGITDIDITEALRYHNERNADVTIVLKRVEDPLEYGVVITEPDGRIIRFAEKPNWSEVFSDSVNTGIYIINKAVMSLIEENKQADFSKDLFPLMLERSMKLYGYVAEGYWCDIGNYRSYIEANIDAISGKIKGIEHGDGYYEIKKGVWVGKYTKLDESAVLEAPCLIGQNCNIRAGAHIYPDSIIGEGCFLGRGSSIKNSILHENVYVGAMSEVRGAVVSAGTRIADNTGVFEGCMIGAECSVGERCIVKNGAAIWPEKRIEPGSTVQSNIVWQKAFKAGLFENEHICGKLNHDIDPENLTLFAAAFASMQNGKLAISHNGTPASRMLYSVIKAGIMATGKGLIELKSAPLPALRYSVRLFGCDGGIYVGTEHNNVKIWFLDEKGINISHDTERKLENAVRFRSFTYSEANDITTPRNFGGCTDFYERHLIYTAGLRRGALKGMNVNVRQSGGIESLVLINILDELGVNVLLEGGRCENCIDVMLSDFGESVKLFDKNGSEYSVEQMNLLLNYISLRTQSGEKYTFADYNTPEAVDIIARANNGAVIRTKSGIRSLIQEIVKHDGIDDSLPVGRMSMYYDGIMFILILLGFIKNEGKTVDEIMSTMPELHLSEKEVECPWDKRARVLGRMAQNADKNAVGSGVKIRHQYGWSLVLPDEKRAVFKVYSEGFSTEYAEELTDICIKKINEYKNE